MLLKSSYFTPFFVAARLSYTTGKCLEYSFAGQIDIQSLISYSKIYYFKLKPHFPHFSYIFSWPAVALGQSEFCPQHLRERWQVGTGFGTFGQHAAYRLPARYPGKNSKNKETKQKHTSSKQAKNAKKNSKKHRKNTQVLKRVDCRGPPPDIKSFSIGISVCSKHICWETAVSLLDEALGHRGGVVVHHEPRPRPGPGHEKPKKNHEQIEKNQEKLDVSVFFPGPRSP